MGCWDIFELVLSCIYFGICITSFIWRLTKEDKEKIFIEFEIWSLIGQMTYYVIFLINGFKNLFSKEKENDNKCKMLLKSIVFKYLWPFVMNSFAIFYLGYYFDWFYIDTENKGNDYVLSIFLHGLSQLGFLIDLFLFNREYKPTHILDFFVITGIYVVYSILFFSIKPEVKDYLFILFFKDDNSFIISMIIISYFVYLYMYMFYMFIVKVKFTVFGGKEKEKEKCEKIDEKEDKKGDKKENKKENKKEMKTEPLMEDKDEEEERNEDTNENQENVQEENNQEN